MGGAGSLEVVLARLDGALPGLRAGLSTADLAKLEKRARTTAPSELAGLWAWHDGAEPGDTDDGPLGNYTLLPTAAAFEHRSTLNGHLRAGEFDHDGWWDKAWWPFAESPGGDLWCVDTGGAFGGTVGQVLEFRHDDPARALLAPSLGAWLELLLRRQADATATIDGYPRQHQATKRAPKRKPAPKAGTRLLGVLAERMSADEVRAAIAEGHAVNVADKQGLTPLHLAAKRPSTAVSLVLLEHGADVNARDLNGRTPLHDAVFAHARVAPDAVRALLAAGADPTITDAKGQTPADNARSFAPTLLPLFGA